MDPTIIAVAVAVILALVIGGFVVKKYGGGDEPGAAADAPERIDAEAPAARRGEPAPVEVEADPEPPHDEDLPEELQDAGELEAAEEPEPGDAPQPGEPAEEEESSLSKGLGKTRSEGFIARISRLFAGKEMAPELVDELEEVLFTADIGVKTADRLFQCIREALTARELSNVDKVWSILRDEAHQILASAGANETATTPEAGTPRVVLVLGVNGSGKTTTIGKLADQLRQEGKSVSLVAGDTFRAAAAEQLEQWGARVGVPVHRGGEGADPGSVVFDGVKAAREAGDDVVLVDTAGRLHTQSNLMDELTKVRKVTSKACPGAPHEVLLVVDATTGQNAIQQARTFNESCAVTGIVLTKLDGTAKGGIVLGVCDELGIPIRYVGVGERVEDLRVFDAQEFVDALFAVGT